MSEFGKSYPMREEYMKRFGAFRESLRRIEAHEERENSKDLKDEHKVQFGLNGMSDWYDHEYGKVAGRHNKELFKTKKHPLVQASWYPTYINFPATRY